MTATMPVLPAAIHRGEDEIPFVALGDGTHIQLLLVDIDDGLWVVRTRFEPGVTIPRHKHTGPVHAFTIAGAWKYLEYPEINTAGSYLYEPAHSVHTLTALDTNDGLTDVWFAIWGANLNLDADDNVESIIDAQAISEFYFALCEAEGLPRPNVVVKSGVS